MSGGYLGGGGTKSPAIFLPRVGNSHMMRQK